MNRYAFTNANGVVVNVIVGSLTSAEQQVFLRDQSALLGATGIIVVAQDQPVWIGGTCNPATGEFSPPPPQPEPEPETLPEVIE